MTPSREAQIRDTFDQLDRWQQQMQVVFVPEPGSELAGDDADWPWLPVTQSALTGMGAARDHLQAVRVHIEAGELFPFAHQTLTRTAILAAAQAVWVLAPDERGERCKRARTFAAESYAKHLAFLRDLRALTPDTRHGTETVLQHTQRRLAELTALRAADGQATAVLGATDVIYHAVLATWGSRELAVEARSEWRRGSGAAHGLPWSLLGRQGTAQAAAADAAGMAEFSAGGSVGGLANSYLCAYGLLVHAFRLLDRRGARD
ncbi:hypothetical protein [Geodermatophilus ruber]|uniref:Uncharacterized protein n=1 Tax=Geodermatophilus ruber TaxID=504800 RepID=A0A1I4D0F9_9ACTN|nr:hypothetical protein [Geodermatophilus ruber]SFK85676.1 hypothetical protein SAMN04488085_10458 [Geodermatophilus ruber]